MCARYEVIRRKHVEVISIYCGWHFWGGHPVLNTQAATTVVMCQGLHVMSQSMKIVVCLGVHDTY